MVPKFCTTSCSARTQEHELSFSPLNFELACRTPHGAEMVNPAELAEQQVEENAHVDAQEHGADCGGKVRPHRAQVLV